MASASSDTPAAPAPLTTVAIVEDDASIREVLEGWIRKAEGFSCVGQYANAEAAVAGLPARRPHVALVDINLPGLSGIECVRQLKPVVPATQFVMLTVYEDSASIFDALAAGATGYLLKRTSREDLIASLRDVQAGGSPMTSSIARQVVQSLHRPAPSAPAAGRLSKRETEVLNLLAQGYLYKEIACAMGISLPTVNSFARRIYEKLHVNSRAQAVARLVDRRTLS